MGRTRNRLPRNSRMGNAQMRSTPGWRWAMAAPSELVNTWISASGYPSRTARMALVAITKSPIPATRTSRMDRTDEYKGGKPISIVAAKVRLQDLFDQFGMHAKGREHSQGTLLVSVREAVEHGFQEMIP